MAQRTPPVVSFSLVRAFSLLALALAVGFVSSVLPAVQAYRTDIAAVLARR